MSEPYLGEIRMFSFDFPPKSWALCNGQALSIQQNSPLFSLLGTTYGGDGERTFQLPNLQARVPMSFGAGFQQGEVIGEQSHTLSYTEMAAHSHLLGGTSTTGTQVSPENNLLATSAGDPYAVAGANLTTLNAATVGSTGGAQPHDNQQPYLVVNVCIALIGIYPSRN
jgi:microcystin-dependent protein